MAKDFYEILGVSKNTSDEEIKKAYKRLAKEHHPDVAKDKVAAEARFKEINEAYHVLSDPEKRRMYDQFGSASPGAGFGSQGPFGAAGQGNQWGPFTWTYTTSGSPESASGSEGFDFGDFSDPFDIFEQVFGFRGFSGSRRPRKGRNLYYSLQIDFSESIKGIEKRINVNGKTVNIKIPSGIDDGTELRFAGYGEAGPGGAEDGDLFITVRIKPHPKLLRRGDDVFSTEEISFAQAILGDFIDVLVVDPGSTNATSAIKLKIPAGTQPNTQFRLRGKGIPKMRGFGRGDHFVQIIVNIPTRLSRDQKRILEEFKGL